MLAFLSQAIHIFLAFAFGLSTEEQRTVHLLWMGYNPARKSSVVHGMISSVALQ